MEMRKRESIPQTPKETFESKPELKKDIEDEEKEIEQ